MACFETNVIDWRQCFLNSAHHTHLFCSGFQSHTFHKHIVCLQKNSISAKAFCNGNVKNVTRENCTAGLTRLFFFFFCTYTIWVQRKIFEAHWRKKVQHMAMAFKAQLCLFPGLKRTTMLLEQEEIRAREWRKKNCHVHVCRRETSYRK